MDELYSMRVAFDIRLDSQTATLDVKICKVDTILPTIQSSVVFLANHVTSFEFMRVGSGPSINSVFLDILRDLRLQEGKQATL